MIGEGLDLVSAYRPHQAEAIRETLKAFQSGKRVVILEAPTGFGKSIANVTVARMFKSAFYTTGQVPLVDQLSTDPILKDALKTVYGKRNYDCVHPDFPGKRVDSAPCEIGYPCPECKGTGGSRERSCPRCKGIGSVRLDCELAYAQREFHKGPMTPPECLYHHARFDAAQAKIAVMTLSYFLLTTTSANAKETDEAPSPFEEQRVDPNKVGRLTGDHWGLVDGKFPARELLIVDEAHGIANFVTDFNSITLSNRTFYHEGWKRTWEELLPEALAVADESAAVKFLQNTLRPALKADAEAITERMKQLQGTAAPPEMERMRRERANIDEFLTFKLPGATADMATGTPWAVDPQKEYGKLVLSPILVASALKKRLWSKATYYLLSSATVLDPMFLLKDLGLEGLPFTVIRVPSTFDPKRAPIYDECVGSMSRQYKAETEPKAIERLEAILALEPHRGIIHCHSYENQNYIRNNIAPRLRHRLVFHGRTGRNDDMKAWMIDGRRDSVFVSVGFTEGVDLHDELARFAVIWKVPYASLGDKRVARRMQMEDGDHWYRLATLRSVIQASGRIVRSAQDEGRVYVLDSSFKGLLAQQRPFVPTWFLDRLRAGGFKIPEPPLKTAFPAPSVGQFVEL